MDLVELFGGSKADASRRLSLYLPSKDRKKNDVKDIDQWLKEGMETVANVTGGCTVWYNLPGTFVASDKKNKNEEEIIWENTHIIYSYIFDYKKFLERYHEIKAFMYKFGQKTNQHTLMIEYSGPNSLGMPKTGAVYIPRKEILKFIRDQNQNDKVSVI